MCGIAGFLFSEGLKNSEAILRGMTTALAHRGPDGHGQYLDGPVALGHRRLSILDISEAGHQPMADSDEEYVVTYNGEIYNFKSLRAEITKETGYQFKTQCDTEILPIGFKLWGDALFDKLEGMFAVAIWDRKNKELTLARDAAGIKPLYIYQLDTTVYFASEIKSFLTLSDHKFRLNAENLHSYFTNGYVGPDRSTLEGVSQLLPGTIRRYDVNGQVLSEVRFWQPSREAKISSLDEASERISATLKTVVADMMISDVPIGIMQSAGIDSSLMSYSAQGFDVPLFTASFSSKSFDESGGASIVAKETGLEHHIIQIQNDEKPEDIVRAIAHATDAQLSDSSGFALYKLCKTIKQHVTVALSGEGGDEFFAGYPTYRASRIASAMNGIFPTSIAKMIGEFAMQRNNARDGRIPLAEKVGRFMLGYQYGSGLQHAQWRRYLFEYQLPAIYGAEMAGLISKDPMADYNAAISSSQASTEIDRWMLGDQQYYLPSDMLVKSDRISMAHSLEVRVPFLDKRIMELAGSLDHSLLTSMKGPDKLALRKSLEKMTSSTELIHGKKRGFNVPIAKILVDELYDLANKFFYHEADRFAPWLKPDGVRELWKAHKNHQQSHHYFLWSLLVFGIWAEDTGVN
ncbi:asparagine synthase (glutamine-hydrolyzing) [Curvivirga sp.]|uniref:asparagine synthase (glutamine-hydrolyzing) n=1 Tax=Curvivirga sp. TaxID=2856848 RepID=UPI003B5BF6FD